MKRLATNITLAIFALIALSGCTKNNGDIGHWFGLWHVDKIEIDGIDDPAYDGNFYFLFQNHVFCIRWVDENNHESAESYARWQEDDNGQTMTVSFVDSNYSPTINGDVPPTHFSDINNFNVITLNNEKMKLQLIDADTGITYTYHLTCWK